MSESTSAKISLTSHGQGLLSLNVYAGIANVRDYQNKADAIGLPTLLTSLPATCREEDSYKRYRILAKQIEDAEARVIAARKTFERVRAAKRLLEDSPQEDMANKLRAITQENEQAEKDKAAAEADLAQIKRLQPKHWLPAANHILSLASRTTHLKIIELDNKKNEAQKRCDTACQMVAEILRKAIQEHITPAAEELVAHEVAAKQAWANKDELGEAVLAELMGEMPESLVRKGSYFDEKPPEPPAPTETPQGPTQTFSPRIEYIGR